MEIFFTLWTAIIIIIIIIITNLVSLQRAGCAKHSRKINNIAYHCYEFPMNTHSYCIHQNATNHWFPVSPCLSLLFVVSWTPLSPVSSRAPVVRGLGGEAGTAWAGTGLSGRGSGPAYLRPVSDELPFGGYPHFYWAQKEAMQWHHVHGQDSG